MKASTKIWTATIGLVLVLAGFSCQQQPQESSPGFAAEAGKVDQYFPPTNVTTAPASEVVAPTSTGTPAVGIDTIQITAETLSPVAGTSVQLSVTALLTDKSKRTVTGQATYSVDDVKLATIDANGGGLLSTTAEGRVIVVATVQGKSAQIALDIIGATFDHLEITPAQLLIGVDQQFYATAIYTSGAKQDVTKDVEWATGNAALAPAVPDKHGVFHGKSPGLVSIEATYQGRPSSAPVTVKLADLVSIEVTSESTVLLFGTTIKAKAIGKFKNDVTEDISEAVHWKMSDPTVATVSDELGNKGTVTGLGAGSTNIVAYFEEIQGQLPIEVTSANYAALVIEPAVNKPIPKGFNTRLRVYGVFSDGNRQEVTADAIWATEKGYVATISNDPTDAGTITTYDTGDTEMTVSYGTLQVGRKLTIIAPAIVELQVSAPAGTIKCGVNRPQFTVKGIFSDKSESDVTADVTWSSSDPLRATVSNDPVSRGQATTLKPGSVDIVAELTPAATGVLVKSKVSIEVGPAILASFNLTTNKASIAAGETAQFDAIAVYTCAKSPAESFKTQVTWSSSSSNVTISNTSPKQGLTSITGAITDAEFTTIKATKNGISGEFLLEARPKDVVGLTLTAGASEVDRGNNLQIVAKATYSDGSIAVITTGAPGGYTMDWSSDDESIATVDNGTAKGLSTGVLESRVNIRAVLTTPRGQQFVGLYDLGVQSVCTTGTRRGLYCWFLGALNDSCVDTCNAVPASYVDGDVTAVGTVGTGAMCSQVMLSLGFTGLNKDNQSAPDGQGVGCSVIDAFGVTATRRYTTAVTNANAKQGTIRRVCSCNQ